MSKRCKNYISVVFSVLFLVSFSLPFSKLWAAELTGRFSLVGATAQAEQGDIGFINSGNRTLTADQQGLRLMLDETNKSNNSQWSIHLRTTRQHTSGYPASDIHSSDLFRYNKMSHNWLEEINASNITRVGYEVDRVVYKQRFDNVSVAIGRQPIDWGSGRFWQPQNVFGAFSPTDLDTDFKPGIDAVAVDWYPSSFSSLTAVYVPAPKNNLVTNGSSAMYYRSNVGETAEMTLLAGRVLDDNVIGASYESEWQGMGWRIEGVHYNEEQSNSSHFWIAGVDYQFNNGILVTAEWHDNSRGVTSEMALTSIVTEQSVIYGLQSYLGRRVLGLSIDKDLTPLWHGRYTLLLSSLKDSNNQGAESVLHQFSFNYSVSNESDLLVSMQFANGKGQNISNQPQSVFGHLPASLTLRLRFYF